MQSLLSLLYVSCNWNEVKYLFYNDKYSVKNSTSVVEIGNIFIFLLITTRVQYTCSHLQTDSQALSAHI